MSRIIFRLPSLGGGPGFGDEGLVLSEDIDETASKKPRATGTRQLTSHT